MANRFFVPDSSPPPSSPAPLTPKKNSRGSLFAPGEEPTTTPAGPPPSNASWTPAGAPSEAFLNSSVMRNMPRFSAKGKTTNSFRETKPSGLSQQFNAVDDDSEGDTEPDWEQADRDLDARELRQKNDWEAEKKAMADDFLRTSGFPVGHDAELERAINADLEAEDEDAEGEYDYDEYGEDEYDDEYGEEAVVSKPRTTDFDMFLNMRHDDRPYDQPIIGEESDLAMLNEPVAVDRVRQEAESMFRRSSMQLRRSRRGQDFHFATIARDLYNHQDTAQLVEPNELITKTEELVCRLYDEGVGPDDDPEKMDNSLANVAARLLMLWRHHVDELPQPEGEDLATIGPGEQEEPLVKATWVAGLLLRMHHTRDDDDAQPAPLPEVLFEWMDKGGHNLQPDQVRLLSQYRPSPASHSLYWQVLRSTLLRGDATSAARLLRNAGWEHVRKGPRGEKAYTGKALDSVRRFASVTADVLDQCPATKGEWDIWNSNWTLFRIKAKAELDRMTLFAEGKDQGPDDSMDEYESEDRSMSAMARKASSQLPWDIYENLQTVYGIICGKEDAIMDTAQDWCEATIGLFGWWDDGSQGARPSRLTGSLSLRASTRIGSSGDYFERLASSFHLVIQSDLNPNAMNPIEVVLASVFEGNINAVIGFLRTWSLPIACSVAEIASLGGWLPPPEAAPLPMGTLDADDLALLGVSQPAADEVEGIKDATLVLYARELAGIESLSPTRNGWEMAIQVLGRMDLPEKSEETVGELLRDLLATLDVDSGSVVDKMWRILNDLGMINFAEETAETFADILSKESHRYGEALWYYALSHRTERVREVLNLLMSYSLLQSTVYPPEKDLDEDLKNLLRKRTITLEQRAKQDIEAAQLLGRMLSGYATLRKFYELRDDPKLATMSSAKALVHRRQAAFALVAVISSADDNIRGGLYDETRDAVVSEDFLLALLGEATVFIQQTPTAITLDQIDILLKAIEDLETVSQRVYSTCEEFFDLVFSSAQGLKGSTPADLMRKSTASLGGSSYVMLTEQSMLASQLQKNAGTASNVERGWDWRKRFEAGTKSKDVLRKLRMGLAKDLAALWLEDADGGGVF